MPCGTVPLDRRWRTWAISPSARIEIGDHHLAIAGLREHIELQGESPERHGLIGGRYKRLWRKAREERLAADDSEPGLIEQGYLDSAIAQYSRGTELDLNAYYCPSNLPGLLRARGKRGDEAETAFLDKHIVKACLRNIERGEDDGWAKPTLLCAAFRAHDVDQVRKLALEVARQGAAVWELKSTLGDINDAIDSIADAKIKAALARTRDQLETLVERA